MKHFALSIVVASVPLVGCDLLPGKFELVTAVGGQSYLVNRQSGEVRLVDGNNLIPVKPVDAGSASASSMVRAWPGVKLPSLGELTISARTSYRDGKMLYSVSARPYAGPLEKQDKQLSSLASFTVEFYDQDQFLVHKIHLPMRGTDGNRSRIVDEKGDPQYVQWEGAIPMSRDTYEALAGSNVKWAGFGD